MSRCKEEENVFTAGACCAEDDDDDGLNCGTARAETEHSIDPATFAPPFSFAKHSYHLPDTMESLRDWLASDIVQSDTPYTQVTSPFPGPTVPLIYCDHTASNRPVRTIEAYIHRVALPLYGNTHTNTSVTGAQSTALVAEARQIVAEAVNAQCTGKAARDCVLFAGSGATAGVDLLIDCLGLHHANQSQRPVIFIGPYEHHSNLIPWRETGADIVMIPECPVTRNIDYAVLESALQEYQRTRPDVLRLGTFTAASNVTGLQCDVRRLAILLHRYGARAVFDYATAAPYATHLDMNPLRPLDSSNDDDPSMDALFFSPHKMLGGVATPGVLVVKRHLVSRMAAPRRSGGGTVFYVTAQHHRFLSSRVERYEGGTPNIMGIIRVGLTLLRKRQIEAAYQRLRCMEVTAPPLPATLEAYDRTTYPHVVRYLQEHAPHLVLLGVDPEPIKNEHYPIFSFLIRCGPRFLHYNYVCALLNDVFGIQSRGGCQCAGPYSQSLLGLDAARNAAVEAALLQGRAELLRPGYTRLSLPTKSLRAVEVQEYILPALVWVATHGWALLPQYRCNHRTGEWRHARRQGQPLGREERKWLSHYDGFLREEDAPSQGVSAPIQSSTSCKDILAAALQNADRILEAAKADRRSIVEASKMADLSYDDPLEDLRWFVYPQECAMLLLNGGAPENQNTSLMGALRPYPMSREEEGHTDSMRASAQTNLDGGECMLVDGVNSEKATSLATISLPDHALVANNPESRNTVMLAAVSVPAVESKKSVRDQTNWGTRPADVPIKKHGNSQGATPGVSSKKQKFRHVKPPPKLMRTATQAIIQWDMIQEGDRLLLGLSGGKDSLSLLHVLLELQRVRPVKFHLEVCTIDPMTPSFDPSPLIPYVESLGVKYHFIRDDIVSRASNSGEKGKMVSSLCAYCARMKRGNLYSCARRNNCNKLVLAQHLDDCAESMMMSIMHNGFLRTMKANYPIDAGDLSVIRPLIYCREGFMTSFAKDANLPVINENCPACFEEPKERARIKKMLRREESLYPNFYDNIRRALIPLMHDDMQAILRAYTEGAVSRSRKVPYKDRKVSPTTSMDTSYVEETANEKMHVSLTEASDDELYMELARRRAKKQKLMAKSSDHESSAALDIIDGTGQVCTLNGGNGSIPCRELME